MIDVVPNAGVIALGKQGENQAVRVTLPNIRAGSGSILLLHQRSDDQKPYPVPVVEADGGIIWTVSSTDTAYPGRGQAELQWLGADGAVVKSVTYQTNVLRALTTPGAVPDEPLKPYTQAVARDAQAAKNAAASATEAARSAEASATQAGLSADNAAKALKKLEDGIASGDFHGQNGKSAYQLAVDAGFDGTETQWLESLKGAPGDTTAADAAAAAAQKSAEDAQKNATAAQTAAQEAQEAAETAVLYTEQNLTGSQQEQARSNINAADKARQNILLGTEIGNPIAVDDAFAAPLCGLSVYGKSTQDGTPSPDNPVPVVSAGDGGSVVVKVTGKNLLYIHDGSKTARGITVTAKDGLISISGTATSSGYANLDIKPFIASGVVILSSSIASPKAKLVSQTWDVVLDLSTADKMSDMAARIVFIVTEGQTYNLAGVKVQLELGTTATAYSPYREQLLTLPTPNGLPGLPVQSGGNYTDPQGQQWLCDEVDLERGVRVQRVDKAAFDGTKTLTEQNAILATPIETPLTPAELAAYKALTAYAPDTVVQASDGAGLKLDYQRDVNIAIKKLEDAVASMTTT
mgnify:FL=1|nr:MAG TPA: hypothetical protein [Caudoviricetes sp.]DAG20291.1 MAG TPA: hypothetical protein [Caudoviricetes sp.]